MSALRYIAVGGILLLIGVALDCAHAGRCRKHTEMLRDKGLDDTFPASDPPATQDFSSPANAAFVCELKYTTGGCNQLILGQQAASAA